MPQPQNAITNSVLVRAPLEEAFAAFVNRLGAWWPRQFTFSEDDFAKHGHGGEEMRAGMASEQGWPGLLERYRREVMAAEEG